SGPGSVRPTPFCPSLLPLQRSRLFLIGLRTLSSQLPADFKSIGLEARSFRLNAGVLGLPRSDRPSWPQRTRAVGKVSGSPRYVRRPSLATDREHVGGCRT